MKRVLAVAVAALMIAGALMLRSGRDDSSDRDVETGSGASGGEEADGELTIGCVPELMEICGSLEDVAAVEVDHGEVVDNARSIDGWMTFHPWPEAEAFDEDDLFSGEPLPVAEDELGLVLSEPYEEALRQECEERLISCAARATQEGQEEDRGELSVGDPDTAIGRVLLAATATEIVGDPALGGEEVDANRPLIEDVVDSTQGESTASQLRKRLQLSTGARTAILAREHEAAVVGTPQGGSKQLVFRPGDPPLVLRVVIAPIDGGRSQAMEALTDAESTTEAFEAAGWSEPSERDTGLPPGDVLLLLAP